MTVEVCSAVSFVGVVLFVYFAFFWKINWIKDTTARCSKSAGMMERYKSKKNRQIGQLPPVFPNGWFGLLESSALQRGRVEHVAALGQNFAVFRTKSGKARIIDAYCPHLGANMAESGEVKGEELECQFHSWRFCGETGKCTNIPYSKNVPSSLRSKSWDCTEVNGFIFVWYHAESDPPTWWPEPIENISNGTWKYQGRNEFFVNCHIQEIPENGADWAHLNAVHGPSMVAKDFLSKIAHHSWTDASWSTYSAASEASILKDDADLTKNSVHKEQSNKHIAIGRLKHSLILFEKFSTLELNVKASQIGPGYVELDIQTALGPICIIQTVTPVEPLLQRVIHLTFAPLLISPYAKIVMIGECLQFERDVLVWNHKKYVENPMLVGEDKSIKAYRRWYKQFYSENSPIYESCKNSIDW